MQNTLGTGLAHKKRKRLGRGVGSGNGRTAGRGDKGQNSRKSGGVPEWFEGGQSPLHKRLPKLRGFNNFFRKEVVIIKFSDLEKTGETVITKEVLKNSGFIKSEKTLCKLLSNGEVTKSFDITIDKVSASAAEKIEKAGGKIQLIGE